jgi:hypothetical protein
MDAVSFLISFLVFIIVIAIVIIGVRWLLSLAGWVIPQPLMIIAGLIFFLVILMVFLNFTGVYHMGMFRH